MLHITRRITIATVFACIVTATTSLLIAPPASAGENTAAYKAAVDEWHRGRIERLKKPDGYLSLVGLYLLEPGENRFGSAESNDLVFPSQAPEYAGKFVYEKGEVYIKVNAGVDITLENETIEEKRLNTDAENPTTILQMGTFHFFVIERSGKLYIRLKDTRSKALADFTGIDRFPVSEEWRITGRFEPYNPPKQLRVPNVLGYEFEQNCPGRVVFEVGGQTCTLEPTSVSGNRLFFVFGDATSTVETYGGGRFMVTDGPSEDGTVVLDFNKAYNPPCAFTPYATCPLPHADNLLDVRIEAGELNYGEHH